MSYVLEAFRARLVADWDPSETYGYSPRVAPSHESWLPIHTGAYDDTVGFPQVAISAVDSRGFARGFRSDGSGVVTNSNIIVDINCWAGSEDDVGRNPDPDEVADAMGQHVRELCHSYHQWLIHPDTDERVVERVIPSDPAPFPDPETKVDWRSLVQVSCRRSRDPPSASP